MDRSRIGTKTGNLLLDALPHEERDDLLSSAGSRPIAVGETFLSPGDPISSVILPTARTISVIAEPREGQGVEAATIGREGLGNAYSVLGSRIAGRSLIGQVSGEAITVDVDVFSKRVSEPGAAPRPGARLHRGLVRAGRGDVLAIEDR